MKLSSMRCKNVFARDPCNPQRNESGNTMRRTFFFQDPPHSRRIIQSLTAVSMCLMDYSFLNRRRHKHSDSVELLALSLHASLVQVTFPSSHNIHGFPETQEDLSSNGWTACLGCCDSNDQRRKKRRDQAGNNVMLLVFIAWSC